MPFGLRPSVVAIGFAVLFAVTASPSWTTALTTAGPVLMSLIVLATEGPMLPGAGSFAAAHFQINTMLVLFLAYGFAPLVAWTVVSLGMMSGSARHGLA